MPPPSAPPPGPSLRRDGRDRLLTGAFTGAWIANLLQGMSFFLFIHLPRFLVDLGADEVAIGAIVSLTAVVAVLVRPVVGTMLDTRGRRRVVIVGAAVNLVACAAYLTVTTLGPWLLVIRVVHGMAEATLFTSIFTIGADVVPASRRTEGLALFGVSGLLPLALGGFIGDIALGIGGIELVFLTASGFALGALALVLVLPLRSPALAGDATTGRGGFLRVLRDASLRPIWFLSGSFALSLSAYFVFIAVYVDRIGTSSVTAFFAAYVTTAVGIRVFFASLPARVGERRVLLPSAAALGAGLFVLAGVPTATGVVLAGVLCGVGHGNVFPILFSATVTRAGDADRGSAMGLFSALFDVGTLTGGPLLGLVASRLGFAAMFRVAAVVILVATAVHAVWDPRTAALVADG